MTTEPCIEAAPEPENDPEIERDLRAWLRAKDEATEASKRKKTSYLRLLATLSEKGVVRCRYVDGKGEARYVEVPASHPRPGLLDEVAAKQDGRR